MSNADDALDKEIADLEESFAKKAADLRRAEKTQYIKDLKAKADLVTEHGVLGTVQVARFVEGRPTRAFLRTPTGPEYKRYKAQIFRAAQDKKSPVTAQQAQEILAKACWVYPTTEEERDAMLETFPGLLTPLSQAAAALAEGKTEDEGKD